MRKGGSWAALAVLLIVLAGAAAVPRLLVPAETPEASPAPPPPRQESPSASPAGVLGQCAARLTVAGVRLGEYGDRVAARLGEPRSRSVDAEKVETWTWSDPAVQVRITPMNRVAVALIGSSLECEGRQILGPEDLASAERVRAVLGPEEKQGPLRDGGSVLYYLEGHLAVFPGNPGRLVHSWPRYYWFSSENDG